MVLQLTAKYIFPKTFRSRGTKQFLGTEVVSWHYINSSIIRDLPEAQKDITSSI